MIENFGNGCYTRHKADEIERKCEELLAIITHEPMTAKQIAEHGNIGTIRNNRFVPNYQRIAKEAKILISLGLVKPIIEEWEEEVEIPADTDRALIIDEQVGNKAIRFHYEWTEIPAHKQIVKRSRTLYALAD